jgi:hypothetical protein
MPVSHKSFEPKSQGRHIAETGELFEFKNKNYNLSILNNSTEVNKTQKYAFRYFLASKVLYVR